MTPVEYVVTAVGAAVIVAVGNAIYQALKASPTAASDEGPIRVKGGSVFVDADDDWEASGNEYKLKNYDNPKRKFWAGRVFIDGVPSNQWNGRIVEIEVAPRAGGNTKTFMCKVKGGIRVTPASLLSLQGKRLEVTDYYIANVRIRDSLNPLDFGPFNEAQSKLVEVVMTAQGN
ncbi:MAG TPA: hypothetical protein VL263_05460 [Vicinamibacterales bacterium]|nr:hypothetical protein [Vicinamibacterales bacterium]